MAGFPINGEVLFLWELKDNDDAALTGLVGNMTAALNYSATGASVASASESVTLAEIGSTGFYTVSFTPLTAGQYTVRVVESSLNFEFLRSVDVDDAPSTAVADNAYCTEADVVSFAQMGDYTASTTPTETQVLAFMENRAGMLYGTLARVMGSSAVGPSGATGYSNTIDTSTDAGFALSKTLRQANAVGAAADALSAAGAGEYVARSERIEEMLGIWNLLQTEVESVARATLGDTTQSSSHIAAGFVSMPSTTSRTQALPTFGDGTGW